MMALLSLAWWTQRLSSVPIMAAVVVGGAAVVMVTIAAGIHSIKSDARSAERAQCTAEWATAKTKADDEFAARIRASEAIASQRRRELLDELSEQRIRMDELDIALASRPASICYPKDIARRLNK